MKTARSRRLHRLLAPALEQLPIFPLDQVQLFPRALLPLYVFEPRYRELTAACLERGGIMAVAALRPGFRDDYYGRPPVRRIAGVGKRPGLTHAAAGKERRGKKEDARKLP